MTSGHLKDSLSDRQQHHTGINFSPYTAALGALPDSPAKAQGIAAGQAAAAAILARRATDGAVGPFLNSSCPKDTSPGKYQCTPGYPFVAFEYGKRSSPSRCRTARNFVLARPTR
jgi:hypothetical protein